MKLPWVGWYSPSGYGSYKTWLGESRNVIVTNVQGKPWHPVDDVPEYAEVLEVPKQPFVDELRRANELNGIIVIVLNTFPIQPRTA